MRPVIERWAESVRQYDLGDIGRPNRFIMDAQVGPMNFRDTGGPWQAIDEKISDPDGETFSARFSKLPYIFRIGEDSHRRFYPDRNNDQAWIQFEKFFPNMGTPIKNGNVWTWDFTHISISLEIQFLGVKLSFILKDTLAPNSLSIPFTMKGLVRQGAFLLLSGIPVVLLRRPLAIDSAGTERALNVSFGAGTVQLNLDTASLVYPIVIDPTLDLTPEVSGDDGHWRTNGSLFENNTTACLFGRTSNLPINSWFRYTGVGGLTGSTINVSYMQLYGYATGGAPEAYIDADDSEAPVAPTSAADANTKAHTTANVRWDGALTVGVYNDSPSINTIIQEIADSYDPAVIQILIMGEGVGDASYNQVRTIDNGTLFPKLHT